MYYVGGVALPEESTGGLRPRPRAVGRERADPVWKPSELPGIVLLYMTIFSSSGTGIFLFALGCIPSVFVATQFVYNLCSFGLGSVSLVSLCCIVCRRFPPTAKMLICLPKRVCCLLRDAGVHGRAAAARPHHVPRPPPRGPPVSRLPD